MALSTTGEAAKATLLAAAAAIIRQDGLDAVSARSIGSRAGVSQALVFYHFGSVSDLVGAACRQAVQESIASYEQDFAAVTSLTALLALGRVLHERERESGNVAMMAQLMSGSQNDAAVATLARDAMDSWNRALEPVLVRVLDGNPLADIVDPAGLTRVITAGFIGLELYDGADPAGAAQALAVLETFTVVAGALDDLGPVARRALRAKLRSSRRIDTRRPSRSP